MKDGWNRFWNESKVGTGIKKVWNVVKKPVMGIASTAANFIPGVGPAVSAGLGMLSKFI